MQIVDGPEHSWYGNYFINLTRRVWYPRTDEWLAGEPQAFTTVLLPHAPVDDPERLASTVAAVHDTPETTAFRVTDGNTTRVVLLNRSGKATTVDALVTDAEAALLIVADGKPSHLSAWHATTVVLGEKRLLDARQPRDLHCELR